MSRMVVVQRMIRLNSAPQVLGLTLTDRIFREASRFLEAHNGLIPRHTTGTTRNRLAQ